MPHKSEHSILTYGWKIAKVTLIQSQLQYLHSSSCLSHQTHNDGDSWEIPASRTVQSVVFRSNYMPSGGEVLIFKWFTLKAWIKWLSLSWQYFQVHFWRTKIYHIWSRLHLKVFQIQNSKSKWKMNGYVTLVHVIAWFNQATRHYLNHWWNKSIMPHVVTRPQWVMQNLLTKGAIKCNKNYRNSIASNIYCFNRAFRCDLMMATWYLSNIYIPNRYILPYKQQWDLSEISIKRSTSYMNYVIMKYNLCACWWEDTTGAPFINMD